MVFYCCMVFVTMVVYWSIGVYVFFGNGVSFVLMFVVYLVLLNVICFLILGVCWCIVSLCSGYDGRFVFGIICDACSLRCS